jgi:hypothetical protein
MRVFAAVLSLLCVAIACSMPKPPALRMPEGWHVTQAIPLDEDKMHRKAFNNPHAPLVNATLECMKTHYPLWKKHDIWAYDWPGVTEKMVRDCVSGVVDSWEFQSWESSDCWASNSNVCQADKPG